MKSGRIHAKFCLETPTRLIRAGKFDVVGKFDVTPIITHRSADFDDGPDLYKTFRDNKDGCAKVVFHPN